MSWWWSRRCAKGKHKFGFSSDVDGRFVPWNNKMGPIEKDMLPFYCKYCGACGNAAAKREVKDRENTIEYNERPRIKITTQFVRVPQ